MIWNASRYQQVVTLVTLLVIPHALLFAEDVEAEYRPPEINLPEGFTAELVAAPPLVAHPLMANFDERGRLFIAESAGRNLSREELEKELPNFIRMLEDTDGDGKFDKSTIFADKMTMPQGALWYRGALYSCSSGGLWRLEDTDDDGVADKREKIVGDFGYTGNAADVHGPFLSPAGRIVWCEGRHGHEIKDKEGRVISKGKAARIFSCLPDGSDVEVFCGGGMDNPVEVDFTPEGEMLGTVNLFYRERGDCLVHWVRGGVYPRYDMPDEIAEFPSTGEPLTEVHNYGHVALSGCMRYRSGAAGFGREFADHWFMTQFNTHKVVRTVLTRHGGTFRAEVHEFLSSPSGDFHPTDVLEDADGSLLVIDTGGWFLRGCPTSQIAKPNIKGAIWRISRPEYHKLKDPRGKKLNLAEASSARLSELLADPRFAVRERATDTLAQRGKSGIPETDIYLDAALDKTNELTIEATRLAVWALARMREKDADHRLLELSGGNDSVELTILEASAGINDPDAREISTDFAAWPREPSQIRAMASARFSKLPIIKQDNRHIYISDLDRVTEHAIIFDAIEGDDFDEVRDTLRITQDPAVIRVLLLAASQMKSSKLERDDVLPLLVNDDFALRKTALSVVAKHPEWAKGVGDALGEWLVRPKFGNDDVVAVRGALVAFGADKSLRKTIAELLASDKVTPLAQRTLLEAIGEMQGRPWPRAWQREVEKKIAGDDPLLSIVAIQAVVSAEEAAFAPTLANVADDKKRLAIERVAAMQGLVKFGRPLSDAGFKLLIDQLAADNSPSRLTAACTLGAAALTNEQLQRLAAELSHASPLEAIPLLAAFERSDDAQVGEVLVANLTKSRAVTVLPAARIQELVAHYPEATQKSAADLLKLVSVASGEQSQRLDELLASTEQGNAKRGRDVFLSRQAACVNCHRVGSDGGTVGPDLSAVGARRERRDLLEAIAFPSASLARGYESYTLTTTAGKIHTGLIVRQTPETLVLRTPDQTEVRLPRSEIDEMQPSPLSIMPQGLDRTLSPEEFADLLAYLATLR